MRAAGSHVHNDYDVPATPVALECADGDAIIFDYRIKHRGLANRSRMSRPVVYLTYAKVHSNTARTTYTCTHKHTTARQALSYSAARASHRHARPLTHGRGLFDRSLVVVAAAAAAAIVVVLHSSILQPFFVDHANFSARRYRQLPDWRASRASREERMAARKMTVQADERQQENSDKDSATTAEKIDDSVV